MRSPEMVQLRDGRDVVLRPLGREDKALLAGAFERLSSESRYRRFFRPLDELSERDLVYLTDIDHHDHEAIVALDPEPGEALGVARYVRSQDDSHVAEASVAVVDDWQGRGRALLERLSDRAREEGIERFTALVQADNRRALEVLAALGRTERSQHDAVVELDIELAREGLGAPLAAALRAAAGSLFGTRPLAEQILRRARERSAGGPRAARSALPLTAPIVVGTDGSDGAAEAVRIAAELAIQLGAPLHVVTAYLPLLELRHTSGQLAVGRDVPSPDRPAGKAQAVLQRTLADFPNSEHKLVGHTRDGHPAEVLITIADEVHAQLIVVGNKGMTGTSRFLLGSVPDNLSHHAPCNVLIAQTTGGP